MSNVVVEGCTLEPVSPATGTVTVDENQASDEIFINDKGVYFKEIKFHVTGSNGGGSVTNNDGEGTGSIIASGSNMLNSDGDITVLEGDVSAEVEINGTAGDDPASGLIVVKVTKAGQTDVSLT